MGANCGVPRTYVHGFVRVYLVIFISSVYWTHIYEVNQVPLFTLFYDLPSNRAQTLSCSVNLIASLSNLTGGSTGLLPNRLLHLREIRQLHPCLAAWRLCEILR